MSHSHSAAEGYVAHQFEDADQQFESATLGTWMFLVTEIMFFGAMFAAYVVYRTAYPTAFTHGSHHLDIRLGATNTAVLIASSFAMVMAVHSAQLGKRNALVGWLLTTIAMGSTFVGIKMFEYHHKFVEGLVPGPLFTYVAPDAKQQELFLSLYFAMTGVHALHMLIGIGILIWLTVQSLRGRFSAEYYNPVECAGLYWHFVDVVWIFLFYLLYLIGRH